MSKQSSFEDLSALMDGEQTNNPEHVINDASHDDALSTAWSNYHLIRDAMNNQLAETVDVNLAQRIHDAIEQEPTVLAPQPASKAIEYFKPVAGFAIAASVTAAVLLGVQSFKPEETGIPQISVVADQNISSNLVQPVTLNTGKQLTPATEQEQQQISIEAMNRMNRYLINYNELKANSAVQGMPPYVRMIGYEAQQP